MIVHSWMSSELAYRLAWSLASSLWQGAAIAAVVAIVLKRLPYRASSARYVSLLTAMSTLVVAFAITLGVSSGPESPTEQRLEALRSDRARNATGAALARGNGDSPTATAIARPAASWAEPRAVVAGPGVRGSLQAMPPSIATAWLAGVLLLAAWRTIGWFSVQRLRVLKTEPATPLLVETARRIAHRLRVSRSFQILVSHFVETPVVIGWLRPIILIPASVISGLAPSQLEAILAHELAHIRRHDYLMNLLQILVETVFFYHPVVWWISSLIRLEREQACDDIVIGICADRREYASALAAVEELRTIGSLAMAAKGTDARQMLARIQRILGVQVPTPQWGLSGIIATCIVAWVCVALVHSPATRADSGAATQPFIMRNDAPRLSPFTAVRWNAGMPEVQFRGTWYRAVSINDISTEKMMAYLRGSNDFAPERHFAEDLVEVMRDMGSQPGDTVKLELETLDNHQLVKIPAAPMTAENRRAVYNIDHPADARQSLPETHLANHPFLLRNDAPRLSPFTAVRWRGEIAEVQYNGQWWDLVSINDVAVAKILDDLKQSNDTAFQKHFAEDLVEVMRYIGDESGNTVKLVLSRSDPEMIKEVLRAPMTQENGRSVLEFDRSHETPSPAQAGTQSASDGVFRFNVPFQQGAVQFLDGDQITVTSVKGTSSDMQSGICCISGTYKLVSHDKATLAASLTAADGSSGGGNAKKAGVSAVPSLLSGPAIIFLNSATQHYVDLRLKSDDARVIHGSGSEEVRVLEAQEEQAYLEYVDARKCAEQLNSALASKNANAAEAWNNAQTMTIQKGSGRFTLLLPVSSKGWPHVSFYDDMSDFGGVYIGTGNWVLRRWWGSKE